MKSSVEMKQNNFVPCGNCPLQPKMTNSPYLTIALDTAPAEAGEAVIAASKASEARGLTGSESGMICF